MKSDNKKANNNFYFCLNFCIITFILKINFMFCQIKDNFIINTLEIGNNDLLDITDNHNLNLIVTTSKNIYTGLPPTLKTTTQANLIKVSSVITINESFLLASCLQDSFLTKIRLSDGISSSLLDYSDITGITPSITVPEKICSLSIYEQTVFIGYTTIDKYASQTNKTNIIFKIKLKDINSQSSGPEIDGNENIIHFQFPKTTILTKSLRQISCEPLKLSDNLNKYRLVCLHETQGYYKTDVEYFVFSTSINENFNGFENEMNEYRNAFAYEYSGELGFRMYRVNDTHARCLTKSVLSGIYLKTSSNKAKITKDYIPDNLYSFTSDLDLISFSNNVRFSAEKTTFMNNDNAYSFRINKISNNYLKVYDYKENHIIKILGYYNNENDYMQCVYQTEDKIKYFSLQNNKGIFQVGSNSHNIQMKSYEHVLYDMSNLVENLYDLGTLNVETIFRNESNNVTKETYGIDFYDLFMDNNIFIPEKSIKNWYRYNFSFIEHKEDDYTKIYYLSYISIIVRACYSFGCLSCWENYGQCDDCTNSESYALKEDDNLCYQKNLLLKGYMYDELSNKFKKCYSTCDFCYLSLAASSNTAHHCESCTDGYIFSFKNLGNCYKINNLNINEDKTVNSVGDEKFVSSICTKYQILSNGECIDSCPTSIPYYSFEYNILTGRYTKESINPPKFLFNKKCYEECPSNTIPDDSNNECLCPYAFHTDNGEKICYSDFNCISDYPYKNINTNQCFSSLNDCLYIFNYDCFDICPDGKVSLNEKTADIKEYYVNELGIDNSLKEKLCICDITNGVWKKVNSTDPNNNDIYFQVCLDSCPEGYEPEILTNQCILKKSDPTTTMTTQPMTTIITTEPITTLITTQPITTVLTTEPITTLITTQPITTIITTEPITTIITTQPITTVTTTAPITTLLTTQPITTVITTEPITTLITIQPISTVITTEPITTLLTTQPITTMISTEPITTFITTQPVTSIIITESITTFISTQPITTIMSTEPISTILTTITSQPITTFVTIETTNTQILTTIFTNELITESSVIYATIDNSEISETIIPLSTEQNAINNDTIINELQSFIPETSSFYQQITLTTEPFTTINVNSNITQTTIVISETENNELIYPEEYDKNPDNCHVIYNNNCFNKCPEGTCINENDPTLMFCVKIKENVRVFNGICFTGIEEIVNNIKAVSENNEIITTDSGIIIRVYSTKSEDTNFQMDTQFSQIDLRECENKLKEYYNLPEDTELFILGIDSPNKNRNSSTSVYNYEVYLENGTKLEYSTACKDVKITISSAIKQPDLVNIEDANYFNDYGYDIYIQNGTFYTDICAPASIRGNDVTLSDRRKDYFPSDIVLCNDSCSYISINFTIKRFTCECDNNYNYSLIYEAENIEEEKEGNYMDYLLSLINYKIIICYKLFSDSMSYYYNGGFYISSSNFVFCLIQIFIFLKFGLRAMNQQILESTPNKKKLILALKEQNEKRKELIKLQLLNIAYPPKKRVIIKEQKKDNTHVKLKFLGEDIKKEETSFSQKALINEIINQNNNIKVYINTNKKFKKKGSKVLLTNIKTSYLNNPINIVEKNNKINTIIINNKKRKSNKIKLIKKLNKKNELFGNEEPINNIYVSTDESVKEKKNSEIKNDPHDLIKFMHDKHVTKKELNCIPFTQALRIDKRNFLEIFISVLAHEIEIIDIFYYKRLLTHVSIILSIYTFESCLDLTFNCVFYTDDVVSEKYNRNGSIKFFTSLSLSFISNIVSSIISYLVSQLAEYGNIMELMLKDIVIKKQYFLNMIKFKKYLTLKLSGFFLIQAIINLGMCYYLMIFCTVYRKTQISVLINYIIGVVESMAISLGLTILISLLRYLSLKYKWKTIYYTSKYLFEKL